MSYFLRIRFTSAVALSGRFLYSRTKIAFGSLSQGSRASLFHPSCLARGRYFTERRNLRVDDDDIECRGPVGTVSTVRTSNNANNLTANGPVETKFLAIFVGSRALLVDWWGGVSGGHQMTDKYEGGLFHGSHLELHVECVPSCMGSGSCSIYESLRVGQGSHRNG